MNRIRIGEHLREAPSAESTFNNLWDLQATQQNAFAQAGISQLPKQLDDINEMTSKRAMQLIEEVIELVRHIGYKEHRATTPSASSEFDAQLEWADIFKFLLIIAQVRGWNPSDLIQAFVTKTVVADSYMRERMLINDQELEWIAFDIDDVLADYTGYFCNMMRVMTGREKDPAEIDHTRSIGEQWGIGRKEWEVVKEDARAKGGMLKFQPIDGGLRAVKMANALGYKVLLITNRPVHEYPRLYSDTVLWLSQHSVQYHALVFGSSKVMKICQQNRRIAGNIRLAFDDHPSNVQEFKDVGVNAVLVSARENSHDGVVTHGAMANYIQITMGAG